MSQLARGSAVTLVWPPPDTDGYSLIVDGDGALHGDVLTVAPVRAVLHRPAPPSPLPSAPPSGATCAADCVELPVADQARK